MKIPAKAFMTILGLAVLCFGIPAFAQHTITSTGVNGLDYATVDGNPNTGIISNDFNDNVTIDETWEANAINTSPDYSSAAPSYWNGPGFWILTPDPDKGPQEKWGKGPWNVPEGGSTLMYLLLAGFTCFGAMFFRIRSQVRNRETV